MDANPDSPLTEAQERENMRILKSIHEEGKAALYLCEQAEELLIAAEKAFWQATNARVRVQEKYARLVNSGAWNPEKGGELIPDIPYLNHSLPHCPQQ